MPVMFEPERKLLAPVQGSIINKGSLLGSCLSRRLLNSFLTERSRNMDKPIIHHHGLDWLKKKTHLDPIHSHHHSMPHAGQDGNKQMDSKTYYWIWAEEGGRRILWGAYNSHEEAERRAYSKLHCYFEIIALNTRDEGTASKILRARLLDSSGNISESFQRFKHNGDSD